MTKSSRLPSSVRASSLAVALTLAVSSVAAAAPVEVLKNVDARSAPFSVAPVVGSVTVGQRLDADEQSASGWRRVRLPNGKTGFVPEDSVQVSAASSSTPGPGGSGDAPGSVEPLKGGSGAARAPVYVGDFSHLASLVQSDPEVVSLANGVAARQTASSVSIWGGVFGGMALWVLSDTLFEKKACAGDVCIEGRNDRVYNLGTAILILGPLIGSAIRPTNWDRTDVLNAWNAKHPDRAFVDRAGVTAP